MKAHFALINERRSTGPRSRRRVPLSRQRNRNLPEPMFPDFLLYLLPSEVGVEILDFIGRRIHYDGLPYGSLSPMARLVR